MRRLHRPARTRRAARYGKALQVQTNHQRLALNSLKQNVRRIRHARRTGTIHAGPRNALQDHALQLIAQSGRLRRQVDARRTEGGDACHVFGAGTAIALVMTAEGDLADRHAGDQGPHALPAINLVGAEGHQVRHRHRDLTQGLHRVGMQKHIVLARHSEDLGQRLNGAQFVVHRHHRDESRIRADRPPNLIGVYEPLAIDWHDGGIELLGRREHRGMLDGGGDDVPLP